MTATVTAVVPSSLTVLGVQPSASVSDASTAVTYRTAPVTPPRKLQFSASSRVCSRRSRRIRPTAVPVSAPIPARNRMIVGWRGSGRFAASAAAAIAIAPV